MNELRAGDVARRRVEEIMSTPARGIYSYRHELWLKRVEQKQDDADFGAMTQ